MNTFFTVIVLYCTDDIMKPIYRVLNEQFFTLSILEKKTKPKITMVIIS